MAEYASNKIDLVSVAGEYFFTLMGMAVSIWAAKSFLDKLTSSVSRKKARAVQTERQLLELLPFTQWVLVFNPVRQKAKRISFLEDGLIGTGRNYNEDHWRIRGDFLEILNSENAIFSRFQFNENRETFEHTNDDDTLSIRSQEILPEELFAGVI